MHQRLKERLVGAAVLVVIAVIFIPMLLTGPVDSGSIKKTNIPERPTEKFDNSKLIPIAETIKPVISNDGKVEANTFMAESETPSIDKDLDTPVTEQETSSAKKKEAESPVKPSKDKQVGLTAWVVQLGSFSSKVNADKLNLSLRKAGFPAFVEPIKTNNETAYRVRVGPELLRSDADALLQKIKAKMKMDGIVLSYP